MADGMVQLEVKTLETIEARRNRLPRNEAGPLWVRRLAGAILVQAFRDLFVDESRPGKDQMALYYDALEWFCSTETNPGSLKWISSILQLDDRRVRELAVTFAVLRK